MNILKTSFFVCLSFFLSVKCFALSADLEIFSTTLSPVNHAYGRSLSAEDLIWNIDSYISIERDNDNDDNNWVRRSNDNDEEDDDNSLKGVEKAIRKATKGAIKDGRLCVIAVCSRTDSPIQDKRKVAGIRKAKPYFPVYFSDLNHVLFNVKGEKVCDFTNAKDLAEGDRLSSAVEEAPEYLPGRIVLTKTKFNTNLANRFVKGKNIDQPLNQLRQVARGKNEKAEEARLILEEIKAYLDATASSIESDLSVAPSLAFMKINSLMKTSPSFARKFAQPYGKLSKSQEIKFMVNVRQFLKDANLGEYGSGDLGRYADSHTAQLNKLKASNDAAIASEANKLINDLVPYTSASINEAKQAEREANRAQKEKDNEEDDENDWSSQRNRRKNDRDEKTPVERITAYNVIESYISNTEITQNFIEELKKLDIRSTNFDTLHNGYEALESHGSESAKIMKEAVVAHRQMKLDELTAIAKEGRILDLHDETANWEEVLEVNYPSLQRTPPGSFAIKALRDSEVRRIYLAYFDALNGEPKRKESSGRNSRSESSEDYEVRKLQYKISKLKSLQKYLNTRSKFGAICVKHLASLG
ncbi:MAG: hypothetical protein Q4C03_03505, partial [bacterium]|nr:hypothetical protein [bacterium]